MAFWLQEDLLRKIIWKFTLRNYSKLRICPAIIFFIFLALLYFISLWYGGKISGMGNGERLITFDISPRPFQNQPRIARIFCGGGGGCVPQEPGPNILMLEWYAMIVPKIHRAEWPTYGLTEMGRSFNGTTNPHFLHSQADSCVNKVPKIDRYFLLNFDKKSVVISCNIFS